MINKNKNLIFGIIFLFGILFLSGLIFAYSDSNPNYGVFDSYVGSTSAGARCQAGQDFALQIAPFGCTPAVVRSDLLEEQNVPVFCQIAATKINPLIKVEAIESLSFSGKYPKEVSGVGFHPAKAALGVRGDLNSPVLNNIGYAVIVLRKQSNESSMPDFVEGNLTAKIGYNIENAFGIGRVGFYLPELSDIEFENKKNEYSFWNGKGYLRANGIDADGARISMYDGTNRVTSVNLKVGQSSDSLSLPGFDCLAELRIKLDSLENPDTTAKLNINGDIVEVIRGEKFLDNKCRVREIEKQGLNQKVVLSCDTDEKRNQQFTLEVSPKVKILFNGAEKEVGLGDIIGEIPGVKDKRIFLGFIGQNDKGLFIVPFASPALNKEDFLASPTYKRFSFYLNSYQYKTGIKVLDVLSKLGYSITSSASIIFDSIVTGASPLGSYYVGGGIKDLSLDFVSELTWFKELASKPEIQFLGFAGPQDGLIVKDTYTYGSDYQILGPGGASLNLKLDIISSEGDNAYYLSESNNNVAKFVKSGDKFVLSRDSATGEAYTSGNEFFDDLISAELDLTNKKIYAYRNVVVSKTNLEFLKYYDKAQIDYDTIVQSYPSLKEFESDLLTYGERALIEKIKLAKQLNQKRTMIGLCDEFKTKYPNSEFWKGELKDCYNEYKNSNSKSASYEALINNQIKSISLESIHEPTYEEYGAQIRVDGEVYKLTKNEKVYFGTLEEVYYIDSSGYQRIYYIYNDGWKWSFDKKSWSTKVEKIYGETDSAKNPIGGGAYALTDNQENIFRALVDKNYDDGVTFLVNENKAIFMNKDSREFVSLTSIGDNFITLDVGGIKQKGSLVYALQNLKINIRETKQIGDEAHKIYVENINLKKSAKVSVIPNINNAGGNATFSFKIGIEKRGIQLTPDETNKRIKDLNETIAEWEEKSKQLGEIVKGLKAACLVTGAALNVKNFISNLDGSGIARQEVMKGEGGWNQKCAELVSKGQYSSLDQCFFENSDEIDNDVEKYHTFLEQQQTEIKTIQAPYETTNFLTETTVDTQKFKEEYLKQSASELEKNLMTLGTIDVNGEKIQIAEVLKGLDSDSVSVTELRDLQLNSRLLSSDSEVLRNMAKKDIETQLGEIYVNTRNKVAENSLSEELKSKTGLVGVGIAVISSKNTLTSVYSGGKTSSAGYVKIPANSNVQGIVYKNNEYLLELKNLQGNKYSVLNVYYKQGNLVTDPAVIREIKNLLTFEKVDENEYINKYKSSQGETEPLLRYYETEPYKGLPAIIPFNLESGWYVKIGQTLPVLGGVASYDDSGRVSSMSICNVWKNGIEENGGGDDKCTLMNLGTGQPTNQIGGLSETQAQALVKEAVSAVSVASNIAVDKRVGYVSISSKAKRVKVGSPAVDVSDTKCTDFMSPDDCKVMFNVCDPVICPSSRCDFGGSYPVRDVIQSGIIGSLVLCLPNYKEGIYFPICISGVKAGIDGLISVMKNHRDCLQDSLDSGKMTGICDEIYSIHLCEFFWRQAIPLAKIAIPKIMEWATGQNVHGGGEYMNVANAWANAENSISYFTQQYAVNSFKAFKARTAEDVGDMVCKSSISGVYPDGADLFDSLTEPDSPAQYHGRFDEIPFTSATVPPVSQYKVFYHIYAGADSGAYYNVYLKSGAESSFYQDTSNRRIVASGYVAKGEYASETKDFTAPSGYKEMCINVGDQEECGFGQASTSFALDYVQDQYLKEQAGATDIKSEKECVSGSASIYSVLNPNLQSAGEDLINPDIYNKGIIRVCASDSPGKGSDNLDGTAGARWQKVGYCGDQKISCWLDSKSVSNAVNFESTANQTLKEVSENYLKKLQNESGYIQNFAEELKKIEDEKDSLKKINLVDKIIGKVFFDYEKAKLLMIRGGEYGKLALTSYSGVKKESSTVASTSVPSASSSSSSDIPGSIGSSSNTCENCSVVLGSCNSELLCNQYATTYNLNCNFVNKECVSSGLVDSSLGKTCGDCSSGLSVCSSEECLLFGKKIAKNCQRNFFMCNEATGDDVIDTRIYSSTSFKQCVSCNVLPVFPGSDVFCDVNDCSNFGKLIGKTCIGSSSGVCFEDFVWGDNSAIKLTPKETSKETYDNAIFKWNTEFSKWEVTLQDSVLIEKTIFIEDLENVDGVSSEILMTANEIKLLGNPSGGDAVKKLLERSSELSIIDKTSIQDCGSCKSQNLFSFGCSEIECKDFGSMIGKNCEKIIFDCKEAKVIVDVNSKCEDCKSSVSSDLVCNDLECREQGIFIGKTCQKVGTICMEFGGSSGETPIVIPEEIPAEIPTETQISFSYSESEYQRTKDKHLSSSESQYISSVQKASSDLNVNFNLVRSVIMAESGWKSIEGPTGDFGLMQLTLAGAIGDVTVGACKDLCNRYYTSQWKNNAEVNVHIGTCYLKCLNEHYGINEIELIIASYNAGPTAVRNKCVTKNLGFEDCKGDLPSITQGYVKNVLNYYSGYSA